MKHLQTKLQPLLKRFVEKGPAGCALAVHRQGEKIFEDFVGVADLETGKPITADTIYRIYSMTKVVTCTAALMLYERGAFLLMIRWRNTCRNSRTHSSIERVIQGKCIPQLLQGRLL